MGGRLRTPLAHLPAGAAPIILSVAALLSGSAGWSSHVLPTALCAGLLVGGAALLILALRDLTEAEKLARSLAAGPDGARQSLLRSLDGLSSQMGAVRRRMSNVHPVSGAPTRERLLEAMTSSSASSNPAGVLGVARLADFELIARFDLNRAHASLRCFAIGLAEAAGPDLVLGQIDRDCFGIWFHDRVDPNEAHAALETIVQRATRDLDQAGLITTARTQTIAVSAEPTNSSPEELLAAALDHLVDEPQAFSENAARQPRRTAAREAFNLEQDVVNAMARGQLETVYQPIVELPSGRVVGAEALLRWDHPDHGPIPPDRFVPMLEARGLGEPMGRYVLAAACAEAASWRALGLGGMSVAVNMGPQQLLDAELPQFVEKLLKDQGIEPSALELELTETVAMAHPISTKRAFHALRNLGVALAADDFGKGYSSLSYLKNLPFDKLKIDREFVSGVDQRNDSRAICRALIQLARDLDLRVLAEGVETRAEVETLLALGCTLFQGYYFSGSLRSAEFRRFAHAGVQLY